MQRSSRLILIAFTTVSMAIVAFVIIGLLALCPSHSPTKDFEALKQQADPKQLQAWALELLKQYTHSTELYPYFPGIFISSNMVILSNPPAFLDKLSLGRMGPFVDLVAKGTNEDGYISLAYLESPSWGGPGHVIEIGDATYKLQTNSTCMEWIPGVYSP